MGPVFRILLLLAAMGCAGCQPTREEPRRIPEKAAVAEKIKFRLDDIRQDGLRGPPDGLVAVSYEFCIPADEARYAEVRKIDPSLQLQPGARGRIGCGDGQTLCIGSTHQPGWREVLDGLAALPWVGEIRECFFE